MDNSENAPENTSPPPSKEGGEAETTIPTWFDPAKGNLLQFLGILALIMGLPLMLFMNTISVGLVFCPIGVALYGVGRFANWYFWYRLQ